MSVFTFADGTTLSDDKIDEIQTMVLIREPDRLDELPKNYSVITGAMLGFDNNKQKGYVDAQGYYHAEYPARDGQAIAILQDDGTIAISFRGTNSTTDLFAVNTFPNNEYITAFDGWLTSVAAFAKANGYEIDIVTGKSLGGACVNMLRDESSKIAGGAYEDAIFFASASPLIADNAKNLINYGYTNDYAHEWYEEKIASGGHNETSVPDNLVYYNDEYASSRWSPFLEMSAHAYNAFSRGIDALQRGQFSADLKVDDFIILGETANINMNTALKRVGGNFTEANFIGVNNSNFQLTGTSLNDRIETRRSNDVVNSGDGDDIIYTLGGDDKINAGNGDDKAYGHRGQDQIFGEAGNDFLDGGLGEDVIYGGAGMDQILGDGDHDQLFGDADDDFLFGGDGDDALEGGDGNDVLYGGTGKDKLYGGAGIDTASYADAIIAVSADLSTGNNNQDDSYTSIENLGGSAYNDTLKGDANNNTLLGLGGDDILIASAGSDILDGGAGNDTVSYADATGTVFAHLWNGKNNQGDTYKNIENLEGSAHKDVLSGNKGNNLLKGLAGNDRLIGGRGHDIFEGGDGNDLIFGNQQDDKLYGGAGNDKLNGGWHNDELHGGDGNDRIIGHAGNDILYGDAGDDIFYFNGRHGMDVIKDLETGTGNSGHDTIRIGGRLFNSYDQISKVMTQQGDHVEINFGAGHLVTVENTLLANMTEDMFDFV